MNVFEIQNPDSLNSWHSRPVCQFGKVRRPGAHSHVVGVTFSAKNTFYMEYSENAVRIISKDAYLFVVKI